MNWMEVSLRVDGELAEAVADVLARFAPNGVATEQGVRFTNEEDEGTADGPITVCAYLPVDESLEETRRRIEESLGYLGVIRPLPRLVFRPIADQNWMEAWKQHYKPIPVGQRLIILPAWLEGGDQGRVPIRIDPGMAFGTGTHPTTQLCLELVQKALENRNPPAETGRSDTGITVIDVGCGSGILSIAALKLGAARALAVDIDDDAINNAHHNADINGIGSELVLGIGSVEEVLAGKFGTRQGQLVLANILAPVIIRLLDLGLADLVAPGGEIVLSGILEDQAERVLEAAHTHGLQMKSRHQLGDWVALLMSVSAD